MSLDDVDIQLTSEIEVITSLISPAAGGLSFLADDYISDGLKNGSIQFVCALQHSKVQAYCLCDTANRVVQLFYFRSDHLQADVFFLLVMDHIYHLFASTQHLIFRSVRDFDPSTSFLEDVASQGFQSYERYFMSLQLSDFQSNAIEVDAKFTLRSDIDHFIPEIVDCIYESVKDTQDALLYPEYTSKDIIIPLFALTEKEVHMYVHPASLLLFDGPALIGLNLVNFDGDNVSYISQLAILPTYRRRKLGRFLMMKTIQALQHLKKSTLYLHVTASNPAFVLYQALGFKKEANRCVFIKSYQ